MTTARSHTRTAPKRDVGIARAAGARTCLADLTPGMEQTILTYGQFSLIDAIAAVLDKTGPADVAISTWTAGGADLTHAEGFLRDHRITRLRFIVDRSFLQRQPGYARQLTDLFGVDAVRTTRSHAKFATVTAPGWTVSMPTSMNLNMNSRLEYLQVSTDPGLHAFFTQVVDDLWLEEPPGIQWDAGLPTLGSLPDIAPQHTIQMGQVTI